MAKHTVRVTMQNNSDARKAGTVAWPLDAGESTRHNGGKVVIITTGSDEGLEELRAELEASHLVVSYEVQS